MNDAPRDPDRIELMFDCLRARQPVGELFVATLTHEQLIRITYFDVRRVLHEDRDFERFLGIQRPLEPARVADLQRYVNFIDSSFPTSVILAIDSEYARYDPDNLKLFVRNFREGEVEPSIAIRNIARVLDGQHRIAGLRSFEGEVFEISVSVFIGADVADQAQIFSVVNLEQTKVRKSLVYDLFSLAKIRSPQKVCHNVAVILNGDKESALHNRIKRLGIATVAGRFEPITQSTFVEAIMPYISLDPKMDRDTLLRDGRLTMYDNPREAERTVLRVQFVQGRDDDITKIWYNYFNAIAHRWPVAWESREQGMMLNRTNGMRAFIRWFGEVYRKIAAPGNVPSEDKFRAVLDDVKFDDEQFSTLYFAPGTTGEARLLRILRGQEELGLLVDQDPQLPLAQGE